jgi:propanediol dehydratase large subunit
MESFWREAESGRNNAVPENMNWGPTVPSDHGANPSEEVPMAKRSKRYEFFETLEVNQDTYLPEMPEIGLLTTGGPEDPRPSIKIVNGRIVEMDGKPADQFDLIDRFIAKYSIDIEIAQESMAIDSLEFSRRIADINVPRSEIVKYAGGMTPAKIVEVVCHLNPVELMMAVQKMRTRRRPANQAHVCNRKDDPALLAAEAATAALVGFAELETTIGVTRHALSNALAILIGSQIGRPGTLTQCACEEALELSIGMRGFTTYAETLSVYGTEKVFLDGDDLPWSKMFLGSAYLSRGLKNRFTSGSGSEVLMGEAEGKSMLYLEARCIALVRGSGTQGVQNGGIDCTPVNASLPGGQWSVMAENLVAMLWDLECASGNDSPWSGSPTRDVAHLLPWIITGTDFIHSGFGATTVSDNMFAGSGFNIENLDDEIAIQRDFKVDCGLRSVSEDEVINVRSKAARALQVLCEELDFPRYTDEQIEKVIYAHSSDDVDRHLSDNIRMSQEILQRNLTIVDVIRALAKAGETNLAEALMNLLKRRVAGDYLQTGGIFDADLHCISAVNDANDYAGPGTGYRVAGQRWEEIKSIRQVTGSTEIKMAQRWRRESSADLKLVLNEIGAASRGESPNEVVIGISPAFGKDLNKTLSGLYVGEVLHEIMAGIEEQGCISRVVRVENSTDLGMIGSRAAKLSGSGLGIGIQSKGTTVIHQKDLLPLDNLELFPMAFLLSREMYRKIGRNAALYAKGQQPPTIPTIWDQSVIQLRARAEPIVVILQHIEEQHVARDKECTQLEVKLTCSRENR